jgi:S4 domain protein YaaA
MTEIIQIKIVSAYITLGQFLKFAGIISYGGEAKSFLVNAKIFINGVLDNRRGRKLYPGDRVRCDQGEYQIGTS